MKCPHCQHDNPEETSFCTECGTKVIEDTPPNCPACGTQLIARASFCYECGYRLVEPAYITRRPGKGRMK